MSGGKEESRRGIEREGNGGLGGDEGLKSCRLSAGGEKAETRCDEVNLNCS